MNTRFVLSLCAALASLTLVTAPAFAHARLDHANPRVGSTVQSAPRQVTLWFTEKIEPAFSRIEVRDDAGNRVDIGKAVVDKSNPVELHIAVKPLRAGTYKVFWRVLSVDTHKTEGRFSFRVER
jgi:methionine-rich copper-binding protein CopC